MAMAWRPTACRAGVWGQPRASTLAQEAVLGSGGPRSIRHSAHGAGSPTGSPQSASGHRGLRCLVSFSGGRVGLQTVRAPGIVARAFERERAAAGRRALVRRLLRRSQTWTSDFGDAAA
eukprot:11155660-Lingulodinium_polyedra.AAC.1